MGRKKSPNKIQREWAQRYSDFLYIFMVDRIKSLILLKEKYLELIPYGGFKYTTEFRGRALDKIAKIIHEDEVFLRRNMESYEIRYINEHHNDFDIEVLNFVKDKIKEDDESYKKNR